MTDKTDERLASDKRHVDAMRGAQAAMKTTLDRVAQLEAALASAAASLERAKRYIGPEAYTYTGNGTGVSAHAMLDTAAAAARSVL